MVKTSQYKTGIKDVRYIRITTYGQAKQLVKEELKKAHADAMNKTVVSLTEQMRTARAIFVAMPKNAPENYNGTEDEYQQMLTATEEKIVLLHDKLVSVQQEVEIELPINQDLVDKLEMKDSDVVMHYKRNMDDKKYIPEYCEGVKWLLRAPIEEADLPPARCDYNKKWSSAEGSTTGRSECQEVFNTLKTIFERDTHGVVWEEWKEEQFQELDTYLEDESPWTLPKCRRTSELAMHYSVQPQDTEEILTHAGFTASSRRARRNQTRDARRVEEDMKRAAELQKVDVGDFVFYWEELDDISNLEQYQGMSAPELRCPLVLGRAEEAWNPTAPTELIKVHRYRQNTGDMNKTFFAGILSATNGKWIVEIARESIVMVGPEFTASKATKGKKLLHSTKKKLCEIPIVGGQFQLVPGEGMQRVTYSAIATV